MKIERWLISLLIFLTAGTMSLFSPDTVYRTFPLIFGVVSILGYIFKYMFILDTGIFLTVISYLFAVGRLAPTLYNLIMIMTFFFFIIGIWFYARNTLSISGMEGVRNDSYDIGLAEFRRSSLNEIFTTLVIGVLLSLLASFIVLYSSLGIALGTLVETLLMVGLSASVFFIIYLVIKLFSLENKRIEES